MKPSRMLPLAVILLAVLGLAIAARGQATQPVDPLANFPPAVREKYKEIERKAKELAQKYAAQGLPGDEIQRRVTADLAADVKELQRLAQEQGAAVEPDGPATRPATMSVGALIGHLKSSASPRQMQAIEEFSKQADAPKAIPELLKLLKAGNPQWDNNACLAINLILLRHPDADCPIDPLLEAVQRRTWTTQQKAAQTLAAALNADNWTGREEEIERVLIPLLTSQRGRVYKAAAACLQKVTGQKIGPDPDAWKAYYEKTYPRRTLDLSKAVYESIAVVKLSGKSPNWLYSVEGQGPGDLAWLTGRLKPMAGQAHAKAIQFSVVLQIPNDLMGKMAKDGNFDPVSPTIQGLSGLSDDGCTIAPEDDEFRKPYAVP